jgi:glycine cleavage system H lipoate-binding protein
MVNVIDFNSQTILKNLKFLPIDRNGNGIIDSNENIYTDLNSFSRGVWIGKYPKDLISNIYALTSNPSQNESAASFVKWVLTDGQKYLNGNGYSDLLLSERQSGVDRINTAQISAATITKTTPVFRTLFLILTVLILLVLSGDLIIRYTRNRKSKVQSIIPSARKVLSENTLIIPKGLYFDKTHTWAFMEQNGVIKVGIDDFLQHVTGTITRIKMKKAGEVVKKGDVIMSVIRNGKQLNLYAPVSGVILEQNKSLEKNSALINNSPYSEGWIYMIEPSNWVRENQLLFMAEKHRQFIITEFTRLRDFLAGSLQGDSGMYSQVVLQDGGELMDCPLSDLDPVIWEDFQTKFIDPSKQLWFYEMY